MINISSKNKSEIKENYDKIFEYASLNNIMDAHEALISLEMNIKKYNISRGLNNNGLDKIFFDIKYALGHYTKPEWRRQEVYRLLEQLSGELKKVEKNIPIKQKIINVYSEIKEDFGSICLTGNPKIMDSLVDDFVILQDLAPEISPLGHDIYQGYELVMKSAGKCQADLPKLMPQTNPLGGWSIKKETINSLATAFELLYSAVSALIASIDEPLVEKKERTLSDGHMRDLEEDQKNALKSEARQLLKEDWPVGRIARHLNLTVEEVLELLDLEEEEDEG